MAAFRHVTDIEGWKLAKELLTNLYKDFAAQTGQRDFWFREQLLRAALSIMNNIAEGFGRANDAEFCRFLSYARASAFEVQSCLHLAESIGVLPAQALPQHLAQVDACIKMISRLMTYLAPHRVREQDDAYCAANEHPTSQHEPSP